MEICCVEAILSALVRHEVDNAIDQTPAIHQLDPVDLASEKVEAHMKHTSPHNACIRIPYLKKASIFVQLGPFIS